MLRVYLYKGCGSCQKAVKWLKANGVAHEAVPIREQPPGMAELRAMLAAKGGDLRALFNTSGGDYRELGIKDRLAGMSVEEALNLLSETGNLVKRPFAVDARAGVYLVGFEEAEWAASVR